MSDGYTDGWRAAAKAADVTLEVPGGGPMFFRRVPKGEFWMGSRDPHPGDPGWTQNELPRHRVVVGQEFWVGTFPVTQRQFDAWVKAENLEHEHGFPGHPQRPAESMDWHQAERFCAWLGAQDGWRGFWPGLPSEAEWEYACRAGTDTDYCNGDGEAALHGVGWCAENSRIRTHHVGELQPNAWGLHDMHGNVWEWCRDPWYVTEDARDTRMAFHNSVDGASLDHLAADPAEVERMTARRRAGRVVRGGSWEFWAGGCRSAYRNWGVRGRDQGFRVCLLTGPSGVPS